MAEIKVTDKRMFTPDGRLREEFAAEATDSGVEAPASAAIPVAETVAAPVVEPPRAPEPAPEPALGQGPSLELPGAPPGLGPSFYDLLAIFAEPISIYLGDLELPGGQKAENLDAARDYIDLLDLLRQRTAGNVSAQEKAVLEDLIYRSRMRYVQKRG